MAAADELRSNLDAAECRHITLGLIFLKYISDTFADHRSNLARRLADPSDEYFLDNAAARDAKLEERDYYLEANVFWVPESARWERIGNQGKQPNLGKLIDAHCWRSKRTIPVSRACCPRITTARRSPK